MRERLENRRWGFESNCFVCEASNEAGLAIPFWADHDQGVVTAEFGFDERYSGAPTYVHGGLVLAVLDEAMAWAAIALAERFSVTKEMTTRFRVPVRVGERYEVVASIEEDGHRLLGRARVVDSSGRECTTAEATFVPIGPAQANDAVGSSLSEEERRYVRGDDPERRPPR